MAKANTSELFIGVDVGGTKILAALATARGKILARKRVATPRTGRGADTVKAIVQVIQTLLRENHIALALVKGIGLAVPGVVDPSGTKIAFSPNLSISGVELAAPLKKKFRVPVVMGNDANLGVLGEQWLGCARKFRSVVGVFVGTGIGGGIIADGQLLTGANGTAGEIGHTIIQIGGPRCSCGGHGCLESLASRSAIERDLREAMAKGRRTVLTELVGRNPRVIKSGILQQALNRKDKLVVEVMRHASEILGIACVNLRHLFDPDVIVLGGGVVEACGAFILPIVQRIVNKDTLLAKVSKGLVIPSALGDDAVVLGAMALAQQASGRKLFGTAARPGRDAMVRRKAARAKVKSPKPRK